MSFDLFADDDDVSIEYLHLSSQSVATEDSPLFSDLTLSAAQSPQLSISQSTHSAAETQQTATCSALETVTSPSIARDRPNDNQSPSVASSQETKPKKQRRHTGALVQGKEMTSSPVLQSLVNFSQSRRPKRVHAVSVSLRRPPCLPQGPPSTGSLAMVKAAHFCHTAICVPHQVTDNAQFFCPCHFD